MLLLLGFGEPLGTNCVSMNNPPCMVWSTLIDLNSERLCYYYPFITGMSGCDGDCNTILSKIHFVEYVFLIKWKR